MNEDTARCCSVLCPDGGSCSLQYSHTGEHYSTQELLLDMQNPDRHEVKRLRKEKAEALAACAELRAALEAAAPHHQGGHSTVGRMIREALSRPDLGAGMVVVERGTLERWRDVVVDATEGCELSVWSRIKRVRADLDALLGKAGG